jgi:2-(3-amino-3-carboxypropyl)histidine synthase
MNIEEYDLEIERIIGEIRKSAAKRVCLQFPEGLKHYALTVCETIQAETDAEPVVLADPTYGGCDLKSCQMKKLGIDLVLHFGHTAYEMDPGD